MLRLVTLIISLVLAVTLAGLTEAKGSTGQVSQAPPATVAAFIPGREQDARVAGIAFRLATRGTRMCPILHQSIGMGLQHLTQYEQAHRVEQITLHSLDHGPGVTLVVPHGPAALAGIQVGDILTEINDVKLPPEQAVDLPFEASRAHERADAVIDLINAAAARPFLKLTMLRSGIFISLTVHPTPACPSQVHLARSNQRNAFADGRHIFLTTGLTAQLRSDDELAFFIAHEMAHNILGHAAVMRGDAVKQGLGRTLGRSGKLIRSIERDADMLGGRLMIAAGYDPVAGAAALLRLDSGIGGPFALHASPKRRIAAMRMLMLAPTVR